MKIVNNYLVILWSLSTNIAFFMDLFQKVQQKKFNPIRDIAQKVGVSEAYVRMVLKGSRNGTKHLDGKGKEILKLAAEIIEQMDKV